jgi:DNA-binding HxlR family transcriptional regulator
MRPLLWGGRFLGEREAPVRHFSQLYLKITCKSQVNFDSVPFVAGKRLSQHRSGCPVNISLEVFGDRWSLLIVRDLMVRGFTTFQDFVESGEGIATNILADRLKRLRRSGIVTAERDENDGRRVIYRLTEKGIDLTPVMLELLIWGAQHEKTGAPAAAVAELAGMRCAVVEETRRRWRERDPGPILPWLGGPKRQRSGLSVQPNAIEAAGTYNGAVQVVNPQHKRRRR